MLHSKRRLPLAPFSDILLAVFALVAVPLWGLPPSQLNQGNARDPAAVALVRFWKTELRAFTNLRVVITIPAHTHPTVESFGNGGAGFVFTNYMEVPAGRGTLEIFAGPPPPVGKLEAHPLVSRLVDFTTKKFFTVLINEPENAAEPPRLEVIADNDQDGKPASAVAQFTVRNLVRDLKGMKVVVGDSLSAQFAPGTSYLVMHGIKSASYEVRTSGTTRDGKPFEWVNEADLSQSHRQTLLVYPDPYGRIRPQLCVDGESAPAPAQNQEGQR